MLSVYLGEGPHTVRGLALALKISKPAVSRALDRLGELGYIRRQRDDLDRRNVLVQKTTDGAVFLTEFSGLIDTARQHASALPPEVIDFVVEPEAPAVTENISSSVDMPAVAWAAAAAE